MDIQEDVVIIRGGSKEKKQLVCGQSYRQLLVESKQVVGGVELLVVGGGSEDEFSLRYLSLRWLRFICSMCLVGNCLDLGQSFRFGSSQQRDRDNVWEVDKFVLGECVQYGEKKVRIRIQNEVLMQGGKRIKIRTIRKQRKVLAGI